MIKVTKPTRFCPNPSVAEDITVKNFFCDEFVTDDAVDHSDMFAVLKRILMEMIEQQTRIEALEKTIK